PEAALEPFDTPYANGYARSKFLSELLCDTAARHLGIPVAVMRVGQVAGPVGCSGMWNRSEWLPSLVISSQHLGSLPSNLGPQFSTIDWVPSDMLADAVIDLAIGQSGPETVASAGTSGAEVYNLRNPRTTSWNALLPAVTDPDGKKIDTVP